MSEVPEELRREHLRLVMERIEEQTAAEMDARAVGYVIVGTLRDSGDHFVVGPFPRRSEAEAHVAVLDDPAYWQYRVERLLPPDDRWQGHLWLAVTSWFEFARRLLPEVLRFRVLR